MEPVSDTVASTLVAVAELPEQAAALVAVAALPVQEPEEPETFPVTLPVSAPENVVAVTAPVNNESLTGYVDSSLLSKIIVPVGVLALPVG